VLYKNITDQSQSKLKGNLIYVFIVPAYNIGLETGIPDENCYYFPFLFYKNFGIIASN